MFVLIGMCIYFIYKIANLMHETLWCSYLRAFCSPACCDNQMSWDGFPKLESSEPTKLITGRKDMRSQGLGRKNGIPIPAAMYN